MGLASPALFVAVLSGDAGRRGARDGGAARRAQRRLVGRHRAGGALLLYFSSSATLRAAEHGVAPLADLHHAARLAYLVLGLVSLVSLPAVDWLRRTRA